MILFSYGQFEHTPPSDLDPNFPNTLRVRAPDQAEYQIKCFYRYNDEEEFRVKDLDSISSRSYQLRLSLDKNVNNVDYYFWVYQYNQFKQTLPLDRGSNDVYTVINTRAELQFLMYYRRIAK